MPEPFNNVLGRGPETATDRRSRASQVTSRHPDLQEHAAHHLSLGRKVLVTFRGFPAPPEHLVPCPQALSDPGTSQKQQLRDLRTNPLSSPSLPYFTPLPSSPS